MVIKTKYSLDMKVFFEGDYGKSFGKIIEVNVELNTKRQYTWYRIMVDDKKEIEKHRRGIEIHNIDEKDIIRKV